MRASASLLGVATVLLSACTSGKVAITPPDAAGPVVQQCDHLGNQVPDRLGGLPARRTTPLSSLTFAWGSPAVTLSCGAPKPPGYSPTSSQTLSVNGVRWYQQVESSAVVWTAIRPGPQPAGHIYVALRVPTHYTASDRFLTALAAPLKKALP
ncbi:MAG TPA: DUF3515 family protein [Mycobacteriales bacterium]|nr:DUF3515 family protein [Mycobacteriales bacterium]